MQPAQRHNSEIRTQTITVKLRLRDKHAADLNRQARAVNIVWNYCNEVSQKAWRDHRRWLSGFDLVKMTAGSSKLIGLHAHSIIRVCIQFSISRDRIKRAQLRWRGSKSLGWVPFNTGHVKFDGMSFVFNGVSYLAMHINPNLRSGMKIGAGSFNQDSKGRWYINLTIEVELPSDAKVGAVGIDLGLKDMATLSDGNAIPAMKFYRQSEQALATMQRAKKTKKVRAIHVKIANRRKDFLHKQSLCIAQNYGLIFVGDVKPSKIAKTRMAKSSLDAGWASFKNMLAYKAVMHGGRMIEVDERWTTQTCSSCGSLPPSRPKGITGLGIREWTCDDCGTVHDRDVNAAKNILRIGLDTLAEGAVI